MNQAAETYLVHAFIDRAVSAELSVFYLQFGRNFSSHFTELRLRVRTPEIRRVGSSLVVDSAVERQPVNVASSRDQLPIEDKPEEMVSYSARCELVPDTHHAYIRAFFEEFLHSGTLVHGPSKKAMESHPEALQKLIQEVAKGWRDLMLEKADNVLYDAEMVVTQALEGRAEHVRPGGFQDRPATGVVLDW